MSATSPSRPALSVIIPALNEQRRLEPTLQRIARYARTYAAPVELIIVDDGSRDATSRIARDFDPRPMTLRLLHNETNRGKGASVRRGMLCASGQVLLMCDADMSTPIEELEKLLPLLNWGAEGGEECGAQGGMRKGTRGWVAIGSRRMPDSVIDPLQPWPRRLSGWMFQAVRRAILLPQIRDTQCGFKAFTREAAREIFSYQKTEGFVFDVEVLALAQKLGWSVREVGVLWRHDPDTRLRLRRHLIPGLISLLKIRRRVVKSLP